MPHSAHFARYAAALPFDRGSDAALRAVVAASLERRHRWTGRDCRLARERPGLCNAALSG